jgi:phospholipase C
MFAFRKRFRLLAALSLFAVSGAMPLVPAVVSAQTEAQGINKINHVVVIFEENWSFDGLYGSFPGANGLANAGDHATQVDKNGVPYPTLPQPIDTTKSPPAPDPRFPANLPNQPFDLSQYVPPDQKTGDLVHRYYQEIYQIDGGKMDKFVAWSDAAGLVMSHYDATNMPEGKLAQQYTLADNFFHSALGGSFLNHIWLVCACTPVWPNAPASKVAQLDANGIMVKDGSVTPDGYVINTNFTINSPHPANITDTTQLVPNQTMPTIGDRLSEKGIDWAWYSGGWNDAIAGHPNSLFQFHHQPFAFFANYADGTPGRAAHLKDETDFTAALTNNTLPSVSFIKALGPDNEHPGYATLLQGQQHVADLVSSIQNSPYWNDTAIIITYDEHGGRWDHVSPPVIDRWGPGSRVPAIIISPFAKKGFVDHTQYETVSILKFIETRWGLAPLTSRDAAANGLTNAFDFSPSTVPGMPTTGSASQFFEFWPIATAGAGLVIVGVALRRRTWSRRRV